ncbi:hypothetical protein BVRB_010710 [Beta vulgaris subsp. vulgaris]|uniref:Uncharacterized protein n=1 Tax=Beta vulgaris subsp. vulgaris TaxID=3555 RepID=A0A0J8B607_BETVV|nr:hypothetical protein BVRB_010710 [Beta vulgaris subsp. vulgaris]
MDEVVKVSPHARAIRDVEDKELHSFFYGMSLWQFILIVAASSVGEELFYRAAVQVALRVPRPIHDPFHSKPDYTNAKPNLELNLLDFDSKADDCFLDLTLAVNPSVSSLEMGPRVSGSTRQVSV